VTKSAKTRTKSQVFIGKLSVHRIWKPNSSVCVGRTKHKLRIFFSHSCPGLFTRYVLYSQKWGLVPSQIIRTRKELYQISALGPAVLAQYSGWLSVTRFRKIGHEHSLLSKFTKSHQNRVRSDAVCMWLE
jgi:hypothetical protein